MSTQPNSVVPVSTPGSANADEHVGTQVSGASIPIVDSIITAEKQVTDTSSQDMLPSANPFLPDEQLFSVGLNGNEINNYHLHINEQFFGVGLGGGQVDFGGDEWLNDGIHGGYLTDYALLVEALDALKNIDLVNLTPGDAVLQYMDGIRTVLFRIRVPFMVPLVNIDRDGGMVVEWMRT